MPITSREDQIALGLTPEPVGQAPLEHKTKITELPIVDSYSFRRRLNLKEGDLARVKEILDTAITEWETNSSSLRSKLRRIQELTSGQKAPKDFPWRNSSNLHVPLIEMHIGILWSSVEATVLDSDPIYHVRSDFYDLVKDESIENDLEGFINHKVRRELRLDRKLSEVYHNGFRDPLAIGCMDWKEEISKRYDTRPYSSVEQFQRDYPSPEEAGISLNVYTGIIERLMSMAPGDPPIHFKVEEEYVKYRGPDLRVVELKDLIVYPATSPSFDYSQFVGDYFTQRSAYYKTGIVNEWFDKTETEEMLKTSGDVEVNSIDQANDRIEGLSRTRSKSDEYKAVQGCLKIDLNNDGYEEMYLIVYHPRTKRLIRIEEFPYWHNRMNYIPFRVKRKTGRLLGECVYDWLYDLNEEVDTQHNQRIDSRTITTVPSFKKKNTAQFDPTRRDQKFYPGVTFTVASMDEIQQFDIKQTDIGTSMQEESWLFQIAEYRDGASLLRSGRETPKDPRAPAKKVLALLSQSGQRIDPYIKELMEPTVEVARQLMELYYQFSPESIAYPSFSPKLQEWIMREIRRLDLRKAGMTITIARSTIDDNPDQVAQRRMVEYNILLRNPLFANNIKRLHMLTRDLILSLRKRDANDLVPPLETFLREMMAQKGLVGPEMPPNVAAMMQNILRLGAQNGREPTGMRQGGPDVSSTETSPSP